MITFRKNVILRLAAVMMMAIMVLGSASSAFAAAPTKDEVEYDGKGKVEVEFRGKVDWKTPKITVTDTAGKKYTATIIKKDNDDVTFKVNNYKEGTKYNFSISGVRAKGTSAYGTVKGSFSIPKSKTAQAKLVAKPATTKPATTKPATTKPATAKPATTKPAVAATTISKTTAKTTATNNAVSVYKAQKTTIRKYEVESDKHLGKAVWEVSFEAKRTGYNGWYEFEFKIDKSTGKILSKKVERD